MIGNPVDQLRTLARELGGAEWVQGPGGNASVKDAHGVMRIKASGKRFGATADEGGHSAVPIAAAMRALGGDGAAVAEVFAVQPRPSLETYFHLADAAVVCHTHPVGAMLAACSAWDGSLETEGVRAAPYARPGLPVAIPVLQLLRGDPAVHTIILRNHGVLALGSTATEAVDRTRAVTARLAAATGGLDGFQATYGAWTGAPVVRFEGGQARAVPDGVVGGEGRYLFPDAVIFGCELRVQRIEDAPDAARDAWRELPQSFMVVAASGERAIVARSEEQMAYATEVLAAHHWVMQRLVGSGTPAFLPHDEPAALIALPSERHRIRSAAQGATA